NCRNIRVRRDIESRIEHFYALRSRTFAKTCGDFFLMPFLNGDIRASRRIHVYSGERACYIKWNAVSFCQYGNAVSADLIGHISVGRNPIRTDDDRLHPTVGHDHSGHVVADERNVYTRLLQFEGGQTSPLEHRAGFIGEYLKLY